MTSRDEQFRNLVDGTAKGVGPSIARAGLRAIEAGYASAMRLRNAGFSTSLLRTRALAARTISIGNLTTGGTGKTPIVALLANHFRAAGDRPAILTRGYSEAGESSDEAALLAQMLNRPGENDVQILVDSNRFRAGSAALKRPDPPTLFLLDDGFQHRRLRRDCDIVLIDATNPFGHDHVLPRGFLREPVIGLSRADVILLTRCDQASESTLIDLQSSIRRLNPDAPIFRSASRIAALRRPDGQTVPMESISSERVLAVSGVGNPGAFEKSLARAGSVVPMRFADHHAYTKSDLDRITSELTSRALTSVITTAKDWVKLSKLSGIASVPLFVAELVVTLDASEEFVSRVRTITDVRWTARAR